MMPRRSLLTSSVAAVTLAATARGTRAQSKVRRAPAWLELRSFDLRIGAGKKVVDDHVAEMIPALNKLGVRPVGAFEVMFGPRVPTLYLLLSYDSPAALANVHAKLESDPALRKSPAAAAFLDAPAAQAPFVRMDSTLLRAFDNFAAIEVPKKEPRIFELRIYESATEAGHAKKMEMFTRMGELEIFRRVGLTPVFFAKNVIGARLPSFTYMLTFPDLAAREKAWTTFRNDPEWAKLKATPGYGDPDILSNISDLVLKPTAYSQV